MELRHLRYFVRAAELLHFTRAAEALGVSQPTLSLHIQQIEREIGAQLFDRAGGQFRHVRLTQAGECFRGYALDALRSVEVGKSRIAELNDLLWGKVTLGLNNIFVARIMSKCIPDFAAAHSGVDLVLRMASQDDLEAAILNGSVDMALAWLPAESRDIETMPLFTDEMVVVVGQAHPLHGKRETSLEELQAHPMALPSVVSNIRRLFDAACSRHRIAPRISLEIDDTAARLSFVASGHAVTVAPRSALVGKKNLHEISLLDANVTLSAGLLTNKRTQNGSAAMRLSEAIRESFS